MIAFHHGKDTTTMSNPMPRRAVTRREFLGHVQQAGLGAVGAVLAQHWLAACAATPATAVAATGASGPWASGGTAAMKGAYPDPFLTAAPGEACTLTPSLTLGPCYAPTMVRKDLGEGLTGLPMRLALRVVKAGTCEPVEGATVDVWHTNAAGIYSALPTGSICNPAGEDVSQKHFMRGVQATDANGRVDFDTVFPGWYSGRTIHIHFTVRVGDQEYVTSQLFFDDAFTDQLLATHPDYSSRPNRDTTNANDNVARGNAGATVLATARMSDGVLQAWKTLAIKA